jgi:hypothetical protein
MAASDYVFAGAVIRYQANLAGNTSYPSAMESAIRTQINSRASAINAQVVGSLISQQMESALGNGYSFNLQVNLKSNSDRGSIQDIRGDLDSALTSIGNLSNRGSAVTFISNPRKDGKQQPGTIPGPIQQDSYHSGDTVLGTTGQFWFDQIGQQVQGAVKALGQGSPMMWLGIGVVALILISRK